MNLLQPMFRMSRRLARCRRADGRGGNARSWLASRPAVESLERRLVPAQIFVVPASQMADATHLHTLQQAVVAAGTGGAVTIEPGGAPDLGPVRVTQDSILIQGEPNVPASILPSYEIDAQASGVRLTSLNLSSLTLGSETFLSERNEISKCLIKGVTAYDSKSRFSQNTFVGVVAVFGFGPATG